MHILSPKHIKLKPEDGEKLLTELNISRIQLPKIKINDPQLPEGSEISDIIEIEGIVEGKKRDYYRVVSV